MTSQSNVSKKKAVLIWLIIPFFAGLLLVFLIILYPKKNFIETLMYPKFPSEVSINYLKNLIVEYPKDMALKVALGYQEIRVGRIQDAKALISPYVTMAPKTPYEWKFLWFYYQILRIETFALKEGDPQRKQKLSLLASLSSILLSYPHMSADHAAQMAEESLALGLTDNAADFYKMAINNKTLRKPASFFVKAGTAMLYVKDYKNSANYFLIAMQKNKNFGEKRTYFMKAVDSLIASGNASLAFAFAERHMNGLGKDPAVLKYMTKLALEANQREKARIFISALLQLHYSSKPAP